MTPDSVRGVRLSGNPQSRLAALGQARAVRLRVRTWGTSALSEPALVPNKRVPQSLSRPVSYRGTVGACGACGRHASGDHAWLTGTRGREGCGDTPLRAACCTAFSTDLSLTLTTHLLVVTSS